MCFVFTAELMDWKSLATDWEKPSMLVIVVSVLKTNFKKISLIAAIVLCEHNEEWK